jgi:hypothetical protein
MSVKEMVMFEDEEDEEGYEEDEVKRKESRRRTMVEKASSRGLIDSLVVDKENNEKNTSGRLVEGTNVRE